MDILAFIQVHWLSLCLVILGIAETIILIVRKPKVIDSPIQVVVKQLPKLINMVESSIGSGNGAIKKVLVLKNALDYYSSLGGNHPDAEMIFDKAIEEILSTPQKKGD